MMFDSEDVLLLNRIIVRKGYETAMVAVDGSIDELRRRALVDGLVRQISTARMLISLANNDVADLDAMLPVLEENLVRFPVVDGGEPEDEGAFLWMARRASSQLPFLREAARLCELENCSIDGRDARLVLAVRGLMDELAVRCDSGDPEVLGDSVDYIGAVSRECCALLRIHALKGISSSEISECVEGLDRVSQEDFDRTFADIMDRSQAGDLARFRANDGRYVSAMYARCVLNARCPELEDIRDAPPVLRPRPGRSHPESSFILVR